ncbi:MAG: helix-turn-helix transcriptional regulator [candidate division KSB1 bacterium]|nr:helix-turn-helix transcriptional regulator [candidate division KSB1 bacterium]MDZ7294406.1 helix-turn-helix transcriptional regulator [candidate division KSB1 bacterium]MDZ7337763.1 helix-turn-helix transcriptional regulator [candidate division KSB1 bacterium]MDZ7385419.1 helix-turn-helix transcriptional regulator [candidate division KSB1 bacterium]MDZ7392872.1 helix-turn-helix transcriptional regulator [candidate division KSB1 bacterium]
MDEKKKSRVEVGMGGVPLDGRVLPRPKRPMVRARNLLKVKRWEAGLKQYELAYLLGCSAPYLSMVENNRVEPTEEFKRRAASIFELPVSELFPRDEEE